MGLSSLTRRKWKETWLSHFGAAGRKKKSPQIWCGEPKEENEKGPAIPRYKGLGKYMLAAK